jgi:hypothetical protein
VNVIADLQLSCHSDTATIDRAAKLKWSNEVAAR